MINFDDTANENKTLRELCSHNQKWSYISNHPYRVLIIGSSGSGKTNLLLNLINNQPDIDKIYLYAKDPYEAKYQYVTNKREKVGLNQYNDPKAFIEKQIKTIEDQEEKQIKAIQDQGQVKTIKKYIYDNEDTPFISKQKEIFNELVDEMLEEITDLDKKKLIVVI